jgi:hypothetical protein
VIEPHWDEVKKRTWLLWIVMGSLLALSGAGCSKKAVSAPPQTLQQGVAQLRAALLTADPEVQRELYNRVVRGIRYRQYPQALAALDRIASNPSLNDQQKKIVNDVAELLKQAAQKQQNAPAPAQ